MLLWEHSAILLTFIKLPFVIKIFVLFIFEWPFYTGFTVYENEISYFSTKTYVDGTQKSCLIEMVLLFKHPKHVLTVVFKNIFIFPL